MPDVLGKNVKVLFCGMAAGKESCAMKHYYAKRTNKFWRVLFEVGLTQLLIIPSADREKRESNYNLLKNSGIGLTDLVKDSCGMDKDVTPKISDIDRLTSLIKTVSPSILAFNGKAAAKVFLGLRHTRDIKNYGEQIGLAVGMTRIFVLHSTSSANGHWNKKEWQAVRDLVKEK